ncbi:MAG: anti-anti-sigma factor [Candidatus Accumulibacter vicinus]|uniref:Anti-anti-sigma factor n=2 Tax=Candidatus Accumulibacter vicinus TaxID=2954382 RepID=A0A084XUW4_9PROT|nr:MAG: anti-anti-sigma factor [Candidatus Accumulibacter vicinus]
MVFSFFKKPPPEKKMVARPAAVPRTRDERGGALGQAPEDKPGAAVPVGLVRGDLPFAAPVSQAEGQSLDLSEFQFSETAPEFQIEAELDPVDAAAEEAAMLYSNGQESAVRALLERSTRSYRSGPGERLWLMLFDLFRLTGQKAAFEGLGIDYAQSFEKSPPGWRDAVVAVSVHAKGVGSVLFKGDLTGDNDAGFTAARQALARNTHLRLDMSKLRKLDAAGCQRLLELLQQARKDRREIELLGRDHLATLVDCLIVPGRAEGQACWLLKLEICQSRGELEVFEDLAVNYAVTFEISPPSWEPKRVMEAEPPPLVLAAADQLLTEAYVIKGDVKAARFPDLLAYAAANDPVLIDCSAVTRMDFLSAGALLNILTTVRRTGRQIIFRHPHYLLAELFRVVGLQSVAEIILARN